MEYIYRLIDLVKSWSSYFGLAITQNHFEDTFYQLLHDKNYDEALKLAQQYTYLDIDLVYKCKWRNSGITVQSIDSLLGNIQDKLWAINESVQTVPISYEACRRLIDFGLEEANLKLLYELGNEPVQRHSDKHSGKLKASRKQECKQPLLAEDLSEDALEGLVDFDNLSDQQRELCRCRQNLLRFDSSLRTYENILGDYRTIQQQFDHVFYNEFRQKCPLETCLDYAHEGDSHAIEVILNFNSNQLKDHLLAILSNIPETLSPYQYRNLLPCLRDNETIFEWQNPPENEKNREFDWSDRDQSSSLRTLIHSKAELFEKEFYETDCNKHLIKYRGVLTSELLTTWFIERALEIENRTLLMANAIQLLHLGTELNIKNLRETYTSLIEFDRIVYDCCTGNSIYLCYSEFIKTPEIERLETNNLEAKYKLLAFALARCDDPDAKLSVKILDHIIELRKRDEKIQLAYLKRNMI